MDSERTSLRVPRGARGTPLLSMGLKSAKTDEDGQEQGDQEPKKRQASQKQASPPRVLFEDEPRLRAQEYQCQERSKAPLQSSL
jgi:hypothetical protein